MFRTKKYKIGQFKYNCYALKRKASLCFMKTLRNIFIIATLVTFLDFGLIAQTNNNSKNMAWHVTRIVQFVEWPDENWQNHEFIIGVISSNSYDDGFYETLSNISIDNKLIRIKRIKTIDELLYCHILFIPGNTTIEFDAIQQFVKQKPILTIATTPDLSMQGVIVHFMELTDNQMPFAINEKALKQSGLYIDALLLSNIKIINPLKSKQ